jgi:copper oxidase (laccase) domain-containing protein
VTEIYGGSVTDDYCTFANEADYFSYRRDGETGRMASLIWIES